MIFNRKPYYFPVLNIPTGSIGNFAIKHEDREPGAVFSLSSTRTQIFQGDKKKSIKFPFPTRWHKLIENDAVWMTDYPIEQYQCDRIIKGFSGQVLVGGLGLGYAATALCMMKKVQKVVIVEKSPEVVELVASHLLTRDPKAKEKLKIITQDLFEYLNSLPAKVEFNYGFYDIWASDGEGTFFQTVCPLYEASWEKVKRIFNWNEGCMRGQVYHNLQSRVWTVEGRFGEKFRATTEELAIASGNIWHDWSVPFFRWYQRKPKRDEKEVTTAMQLYVSYYGRTKNWLSLWEKLVA